VQVQVLLSAPSFFHCFHMKPARLLVPALLLVLAVGPGCATRYSVTLTNGSSYVAHGKPHYDKARNHYVFTDAATGRKLDVSALSIREIAPYDMRSADNSTFLATPSQ
jgi:hypothetical protein